MVSINELIIDSKNSENTYELSDNLYIFFFSMIDSFHYPKEEINKFLNAEDSVSIVR